MGWQRMVCLGNSRKKFLQFTYSDISLIFHIYHIFHIFHAFILSYFFHFFLTILANGKCFNRKRSTGSQMRSESNLRNQWNTNQGLDPHWRNSGNTFHVNLFFLCYCMFFSSYFKRWVKNRYNGMCDPPAFPKFLRNWKKMIYGFVTSKKHSSCNSNLGFITYV